MARRGKLKFKDVVKSHEHKNKVNKKPRHNSKKFVNKVKKEKRKHTGPQISEDAQPKKPKLEAPAVEEESAVSSDDEFTLSNLLKTFQNVENKKRQIAIDSSDSEEENDELSEENPDHDEEAGSISDDSSLESQDNQHLDAIKEDISEHSTDGDESENDADEDNPSISQGELDDDTENTEDPFVKHISYELNDDLLNSLQSTPVYVRCDTENWPQLGNMVVQIPKCEVKVSQSSVIISENKTFAPEGTIPKLVSKSVKPETLFIKSQIIGNLYKVNKNVTGSEHFNSLQAELFSVINNYQDLYYPYRTFENAEAIRYTYCLHAVNHILKTRLKVIHHNARLSKKDEVPEEFRDQGLVRPKVLFIVPFKDAAYKIIRLLIDLILPEDKGNVMNKNRFLADYTGNELYLPKKNPKPEDYEQTFQGNSSDEFKMGITVTKKSLKLYADFYSSDIIVASPLGLRTIIGAEGETERDYDFLASIELLIFDQTEIFLMQNWDHVLHIMNHIHLQPKESHGTDFSRY
ncbi:unnamed protein product [Acanthoscelides obtectus]|uniref:UTP25 NTP hydrolase-like domain-containing protein n=1 Tax=Acanthoscelides obtectus TaxID=200917 RepID=A0A9P0PNI4_ACAOB|nr:unnamed protein product [Acanthoscelides obtectus]CAK1658878.1 Digestive organ expansion factor homolog [Acanthoscelides obtectus]